MRAVLLMAAIAAVVTAQPDLAPDTGPSRWAALGPGASVRIVASAGPNHDTPAVALSYELGAGRFSAAGLPVAGKLGRMQRIRFSVRSDHDTPLAVILSEKKPGGGDYTAWFWAPAESWQDVELTPADFTLNSGPSDPPDPDGKLDLDQVQGLAIFDLAFFFSAMPESANFPIVVSKSTGRHTLLLANVQVLNSSAALSRNPQLIDGFDRGFLEWITLGGMRLQLSAKGNPLGMASLQAGYEQAEARFSLLTRRLSNLDLSKAKRLAFDVASECDAVLVVSLEVNQAGANNGPRYNLSIFPPADRKPFHVSLRLADFEHDVNSPAGPARLGVSPLKSLSITDITVASGGQPGANTIWIGKVEALPE